MLERRLVSLLGTTAKHMLTGLLHAVRAVFLTFIIVALIVAIITEVVGAYIQYTTNKTFVPSGATHLAAAALAIAFGYAAAVTVALEEIIRSIIKAVELIIEEAEKLEKKAVEEIEVLGRKAGEEALRVGKAAVTDAGALGHTAFNDVGAVGRAVGGAVSGVVTGAEHDVQRVGAHLPGHHSDSTAPTQAATEK